LRPTLAGQQTRQRIVTPLVVVVEIFVAQRQPVDPLGDHFLQLVPDVAPIPAVPKTCRKTRHQIQARRSLTQ
jgi:hypothetical protein